MWSIVPLNKIVSKCDTTRYLKLSLVLACLYCQLTLSLKYYYGDGSLYVGDVDEQGRPSGHGEFYNISGALGTLLSMFLNKLILWFLL